jgi:hypothetical protein
LPCPADVDIALPQVNAPNAGDAPMASALSAHKEYFILRSECGSEQSSLMGRARSADAVVSAW